MRKFAEMGVNREKMQKNRRITASRKDVKSELLCVSNKKRSVADSLLSHKINIF